MSCDKEIYKKKKIVRVKINYEGDEIVPRWWEEKVGVRKKRGGWW